MVEQSKRYEETMGILRCEPVIEINVGIYEKQIALVKEKFITDIKELQTKINVYFNQSENFKKSLSTTQEKRNLEKIFEKYADTTTLVSQVKNNSETY